MLGYLKTSKRYISAKVNHKNLIPFNIRIRLVRGYLCLHVCILE